MEAGALSREKNVVPPAARPVMLTSPVSSNTDFVLIFEKVLSGPW